MANKITETITLKLTGANASVSMSGNVTTDQVGTGYCEETQLITTADAVALDIPADIDEGKLAHLMVKNTALIAVDASGVALAEASQPYVDIATDEPMVNKIARIQPTKSIYINPPAGTKALYAKSNLADTEIVFLAIEA